MNDTDITLTEALFVLLFEGDYFDIDGSNVIDALRRGQQAVMNECGLDALDIHTKRPTDEIDGYITYATRNGAVNIFAA